MRDIKLFIHLLEFQLEIRMILPHPEFVFAVLSSINDLQTGILMQ